jgi:hypothetical protein
MKDDEQIILSTTSDEDELIDVSEEEFEIAHEVAEKLLEIGHQVTLGRVIAASCTLLVLFLLVAASWHWAIPRDSMSVESRYYQRGGTHVFLVSLDNDGSRAVTDVRVTISFSDVEGELVDSTSWSGDILPAHSSVTGDDLELVIQGHTVWDEYQYSVILDWTDGKGSSHSQRYDHTVGNYASDWFVDTAPTSMWLL